MDYKALIDAVPKTFCKVDKRKFLYFLIKGLDDEDFYRELVYWDTDVRIVPKDLLNENLCSLAVTRRGESIFHLPKRYQTGDNWRKAVSSNPRVFQEMPESLKTPEICEVAVMGDVQNFSFIPKELQTPELALRVVKESDFTGTLEAIPETCRSREVCLVAVKKNPDSLSFVPKEHLDREMCQTAIESPHFCRCSCLTGESIPEEFLDRELSLKMVTKAVSALHMVPKKHIDEEFLVEVAKKNGKVLSVVQNDQKSERLCMEAFEQDHSSICFFPDELMSRELWKQAILREGSLVREAVFHIKDTGFYVGVLKENPNVVWSLPENMTLMLGKELLDTKERQAAFFEMPF